MWDAGNGQLLSKLDDRSWEALTDLSPNDAVAVIDQVNDGMKRESIRNPAAFFMAIAKRYLLSSGVPPRSGYSHLFTQPKWQGGGPSYPPAAPPMPPSMSSGPSRLHDLPEDLRRRAYDVISKNPRIVHEGIFDSGVVSNLLKLSNSDAMDVFEELLNSNLINVRNISAYVMGMIRKRKNEGRN